MSVEDYGYDVKGMHIKAIYGQGRRGEKGDAPEHEWDGTSLRFMNPNDTWGPYTDLRGPQGDQGPQGDPGPVFYSFEEGTDFTEQGFTELTYGGGNELTGNVANWAGGLYNVENSVDFGNYRAQGHTGSVAASYSDNSGGFRGEGMAFSVSSGPGSSPAGIVSYYSQFSDYPVGLLLGRRVSSLADFYAPHIQVGMFGENIVANSTMLTGDMRFWTPVGPTPHFEAVSRYGSIEGPVINAPTIWLGRTPQDPSFDVAMRFVHPTRVWEGQEYQFLIDYATDDVVGLEGSGSATFRLEVFFDGGNKQEYTFSTTTDMWQTFDQTVVVPAGVEVMTANLVKTTSGSSYGYFTNVVCRQVLGDSTVVTPGNVSTGSLDTTGDVTIGGETRSDSFVEGESGYRVDQDGNLEVESITVRSAGPEPETAAGPVLYTAPAASGIESGSWQPIASWLHTPSDNARLVVDVDATTPQTCVNVGPSEQECGAASLRIKWRGSLVNYNIQTRRRGIIGDAGIGQGEFVLEAVSSNGFVEVDVENISLIVQEL